MYLRPEEHEVCTGDLIRMTTFTATKAELMERLAELARAGYAHLAIGLGYDHPERLEEWADVFSSI